MSHKMGPVLITLLTFITHEKLSKPLHISLSD